ncbi:MAG: gamma-glutamylcyclotransferase [Alphaproteobacteria bacterium]
MDGEGDIWIFAYGSLMWRPGFAYVEAAPALLRGYHRAFCVYSWRYRGTPERPGLVLGLDRGGSCRGRAFRVARERAEDVLAYLEKRELSNRIYHRRLLSISLPNGRAKAYAHVARRDHRQYAGKLSLDRAAELVADGVGAMGPAYEYLENTVAHLDALGIHEPRLHDLLTRTRALRGL